MDKRPIGIFDSGVGGMTVLSEIAKELPNENLIYLGDTKNFPYGDKSRENIIKISKKCAKFLIEQNVKLIVIACGTATSQSLEELKKEFSIPIIGIITPTIYDIKKNTISTKTTVGVIATEGTIRSNKWESGLKAEIPNVEVINKACPLLAPMAEQGWIKNNVAKEAIKEYMKIFKDKNLDKIILGCTHYPLFKDLIKEELGTRVEIINTGEKIAKYLNKYLTDNGIRNEDANNSICKIYLTDTECNFINVAKNLLNDDDVKDKIDKVNIE